MQLIILHYQLRPGGIRRVIELATPHLVRGGPRAITEVLLATGEAPDKNWRQRFISQLPGIPVTVWVESAFGYLSEQTASAQQITVRIRSSLAKLFAHRSAANCLVWTHNPGVGRNLILARELPDACAARGIPLIAHHHDWWFDNRWARWKEMRKFGFSRLDAPAKAVFPAVGKVVHASINRADTAILTRHLGKAAFWLPNLTEPARPPVPSRTRAVKRWLAGQIGRDAPVWIVPCRTLRRKNLAEALLLARWLRPEAFLVVTGGPSSADEHPYFDALRKAAHAQSWPLRLGLLAHGESRKPNVSELLAASEAVLLTSVQEGFGLPYLEAAAVLRPIIARRLLNIFPDLTMFGFRFPQAYDDLLVSSDLFDWAKEKKRQQKLWEHWRRIMPSFPRKIVELPALLTIPHPGPVSFSRLTLSAQLEVLSQPPAESWKCCARLNPFLGPWQKRAAVGELRITKWPPQADRWLGGAQYARRFYESLSAHPGARSFSPQHLQNDFIAQKLSADNLYPLLWSVRT